MKKTKQELLEFLELEPFDVVIVHDIQYLVLPVGEDIRLMNIKSKATIPLEELLNHEYEQVESNLLGSRSCIGKTCDECPLEHFDCVCPDKFFDFLNEIKDDLELYDLVLRRLLVEVK